MIGGRAKKNAGLTAEMRSTESLKPDFAVQYKGADAYRKSWEEWLPTFQGPVGFDRREVSITAGDDVAFCHCLNRITGKRTDGTESDVWVRATVCYRKMDGKWLVAHEHVSVPFYSIWTAVIERRLISNRSASGAAAWRAKPQQTILARCTFFNLLPPPQQER